MFIKRMLEPFMLAVLTLAYYKLPWADLPGPIEIWGIPFLFVYVLFLPGNMLRRILCPQEQDPVTRVVLGILYGLFFFFFVTFLWALTRAELAWLRLNLPGWIFLLYIGISMRRGQMRNAAMLIKPIRNATVALVLLCFSIFILVWSTSLPIDYSSDALDHIAYVNEIQATGEAFPTSAFHAEAGENGRDIRKGLLHIFYGFTGDYLSLEGLRCLQIWNAFFASILIGSIYAVALALFGNQWIALLSSVFFIIGSIGGLEGTTLRESFYADRFGYVFILFLIVFLLRYVKERRWRDLVNCAIFAFAASAAHISFAVLCCFAVAIVVSWKVCFRAPSFRWHLLGGLLAAAAIVGGILPYGLFRFMTVDIAPHKLIDQAQGIVHVGGGLFIANPVELFSWFGFQGIATFFIALVVWRYRKDYAGLGYLIAACFSLPLILLNPLLLPLLQVVPMHESIYLAQLFPFYMLAAYFVVNFITGNGGKQRRTPIAWVLLVSVCLAAAVDFLPIYRQIPVSPASLRAEKQESYLRWEDGLAYLRDNIPEGSIIVSDPLTAYSIVAFTSHYVTCIYDQHVPPGDRPATDRLEVTREILNPFAPVATSIELMESLDADYIVLNNRIGKTESLRYWAMQADVYFPVRERFISHNNLFRLRFHSDGFLVLEWSGRKPEDVEIAANPYLLQTIPPDFSRIGLQAGEAKLEACFLEKTHAGRGTELENSFIWSGNKEYRMRDYVVEVRFVHEDPDLLFGGKPFPKLARKIKEAVKGERYRFAVSHKILSGFLSPDMWPDNTFVLDQTTVSIPSDIAAGQYSISVELFVQAETPNKHIKNFLFEDENCRGVQLGKVILN